MDAVPEQIGMRLLQAAWAVGVAAVDVSELAIAQGLRPLAVTQRRGAKHGHLVSLGRREDRYGVGQ